MEYVVTVTSSTGIETFSVIDPVGEELDTEKNREQILRFLNVWTNLLLDAPTGRKPARVIHAFLRGLGHGGLKTTILAYGSLANTLMHDLGLYGTGAITSTWIAEFANTPIFRDYLAFYRSCDQPRRDILQYLLSFLLFGKKLEVDDPSLEPEAFRSWLGVEEKLAQHTYQTSDVEELRTVVSVLLQHPDHSYPHLDPDDFIFRFGPGKVAEHGVSTPIEKASRSFDRGITEGMAYAFRNVYVPNKPSLSQRGKKGKRIKVGRPRDELISKVEFVRKNMKTDRSICKEPGDLMLLQQGILSGFAHQLPRLPIGNFVCLTDQQLSRDLAVTGSLYGTVDTLDLSSASDSVSWDLVKGIFPSDYIKWFQTTRSSRVRTKDGVIGVRKFAPMGSAVCFPTQCIVFTASVVLCAVRHAISHGWVRGSSFRECVFHTLKLFKQACTLHANRRFQPLRVFGDDIICDSILTESVIALLEGLGFTVNVNKSFVGNCAVRETCGIYCYQGEDVTPLYYQLPLEQDGRLLMSAVALTNRIGDYRYRRTYSTMLRFVTQHKWLQHHPAGILFSPNRNDPLSIYHPNPRNSHLEMVPHGSVDTIDDYQLDGYVCLRVRVIGKVGRSNAKFEEYSYYRWHTFVGDHYDYHGHQLFFPTSRGLRIDVGWTPRRW